MFCEMGGITSQIAGKFVDHGRCAAQSIGRPAGIVDMVAFREIIVAATIQGVCARKISSPVSSCHVQPSVR